MTSDKSDQRFKYSKAQPFHTVTNSTTESKEPLFRSHGHPVVPDHLKNQYKNSKIA